MGKERLSREVNMAAVRNGSIQALKEEGVDTDGPIYVAQPYLPPLDEFIPYLQKIWETKKLTNGGPFHQQLEEALSEFLGVRPHFAVYKRNAGLGNRAPGIAYHR